MPVINRSLGLAALGWWLTSRGLSEPIDESFTRLEPGGVQRLGKASRIAALVATRRLASALGDHSRSTGGQPELFSGETRPPSWVDRLENLLATPRIGLKLEKALTGDAEDFDALLEVELAEDRSLMLAARLAEWLREQLGAEEEPASLSTFLAHGWPIARGADRQVTFVQEFLANFNEELSDAPAEITLPLGEPDEFREWLAKEAGQLGAVTSAGTSPAPRPAAERSEPPPPEPSADSQTPPESSPAEEATVGAPESLPPSQEQTHAEERPITTHAPFSEGSDEERRRSFRVWPLLFQASWVALLILGWRAFQQRHAAVSAAASPSPTLAHVASPTAPVVSPSSTPAAALAAPAASPLPATPSAALAIAPLPQKPEMTLLPDELLPRALELASAGHHAEAVGVFRRIAQIQAQDRSAGRLPRALIFARLASSLAALERWDEADAVVERAQALLEELLPTQDAETALGLEMVADYWASRERWPLAARLYQKALQTYEGTPAENSAQELSVINRLGGALRQVGDTKRAEQLYRQLVRGYEGLGPVAALDAATANHNLANLLLVTGRAGEAGSYYEKALALLVKAAASGGEVDRIRMVAVTNYERCLVAMGVPAQEARQRAEKAAKGPAK